MRFVLLVYVVGVVFACFCVVVPCWCFVGSVCSFVCVGLSECVLFCWFVVLLLCVCVLACVCYAYVCLLLFGERFE